MEKVYVFMCLNDIVSDTFCTDENEIKRLVEEANEEHGGDFWYKELVRN